MKDDYNALFSKLKLPRPDSHKGQNGKLLVIGGSSLFHAASIWALEVASRIVDLVHYSSTPENNEIVREIKKQFRDGIIVSRQDVEEYIKEDDCILIGPGMMRPPKAEITNHKSQITNKIQIKNLKELELIEDEGWQTAALTNYLLTKYPRKQWVIDAGALQMMDIENIPQNAILTPHQGEFDLLLRRALVVNKNLDPSSVAYSSSPSVPSLRASEAGQNFVRSSRESVNQFATRYDCVVLLKGKQDIICSPKDQTRAVGGGNAGMTKGGTGDVLAGLVAALACKNDPFLAATAASYINKRAGDELYQKVGPFFNASDLAGQIPETMRELTGKSRGNKGQ